VEEFGWLMGRDSSVSGLEWSAVVPLMADSASPRVSSVSFADVVLINGEEEV
jgi:hypothetical protein